MAPAGILRLTDQPDGSAVVERVEDMQSAPAASAQTDEEPASSVISAEEQQSAVGVHACSWLTSSLPDLETQMQACSTTLSTGL